jgi:hypothetical protein
MLAGITALLANQAVYTDTRRETVVWYTVQPIKMLSASVKCNSKENNVENYWKDLLTYDIVRLEDYFYAELKLESKVSVLK